MSSKTDLGLMLLAADALGGRAETMRKHIPEVRRNEDIEAVHQMRVSSRRLRAALTIFKPMLSDVPARRWRKSIRSVTRALGVARDQDVQIEFINQFIERHVDEKRHRPGLDRLLLRIQQQRDRQQEPVWRAMDALETDGVLNQISQFARKTIARGRLDRVSSGGDAAMTFAQDAIRARLGELISFESYVRQPDCAEQLHEMRITAKWLRYTMEVFVPVFGGQIKPYIKHTKRVQTCLGNLHDQDVWLAQLPEFIEQERARTNEYFGHTRGFGRLCAGLDYLTRQCGTTRQSIYQEFVSTWETLDADSVWDRLLQMCDPPSDPEDAAAPDDQRTPLHGDTSTRAQ